MPKKGNSFKKLLRKKSPFVCYKVLYVMNYVMCVMEYSLCVITVNPKKIKKKLNCRKLMAEITINFMLPD